MVPDEPIPATSPFELSIVVLGCNERQTLGADGKEDGVADER